MDTVVLTYSNVFYLKVSGMYVGLSRLSDVVSY
jgi:hypothetical protein